jgi:hypothetical protein
MDLTLSVCNNDNNIAFLSVKFLSLFIDKEMDSEKLNNTLKNPQLVSGIVRIPDPAVLDSKAKVVFFALYYKI